MITLFYCFVFIALVYVLACLVLLFSEEMYEHPKDSESMSRLLREIDEKKKREMSNNDDEMEDLKRRLRGF